MTESQLSTKIQKLLPEAHWQRIENQVGVGCPDLNGCYQGKELWFELKIWGGAKLRGAQASWHMRRRVVGGKSFILTYKEATKTLYVSRCVEDFSVGYRVQRITDFVLTKPNLQEWIESI